MANADLLWKVVSELWPSHSKSLTIAQVVDLVPLGTEGITNRSSYDFAVLTMLSTVRRSFVLHCDQVAKESIDNEVVIVNRNNGIWKLYRNSEVKRLN